MFVYRRDRDGQPVYYLEIDSTSPTNNPDIIFTVQGDILNIERQNLKDGYQDALDRALVTVYLKHIDEFIINETLSPQLYESERKRIEEEKLEKEFQEAKRKEEERLIEEERQRLVEEQIRLVNEQKEKERQEAEEKARKELLDDVLWQKRLELEEEQRSAELQIFENKIMDMVNSIITDKPQVIERIVEKPVEKIIYEKEPGVVKQDNYFQLENRVKLRMRLIADDDSIFIDLGFFKKLKMIWKAIKIISSAIMRL